MSTPIMLSSIFTSISTLFVSLLNFKYIFFILLKISYPSDTLTIFECNGNEMKLNTTEYKNAGYKKIRDNIYLVIHNDKQLFEFYAHRLECNNDGFEVKELLR